MRKCPALCLLLSLVLLFTSLPQVEAVRGTTNADRKQADLVWTKAASTVPTTSYGQPEIQLLTKTMSADHFGSVQYSQNATFEMQYALVWPADAPTANSPIFLFCGQETPITQVSVGSGVYSDYASSHGALQIWPEHRYYAQSSPYTPVDNLAHFSIEQALVDHVELVLYIQSTLNMTRNPVIALGSSYSAQLASYLRIRYPDVIAGAVSSSPASFGCPGLGLDPSYDPYGFAKVATWTASSEAGSAAACPVNVQKFFQTLFQLAPTGAGRVQINQDMNLCSDSMVTSVDQMNQTLAQFVQGQWVSASQYNAPIADLGTTGIPANRVQTACGLFSDSSMQGSDLLSAMVTAMGIFTANASLANGCLDITGATPEPEPEPYVPAEAPASAIASLAPGPELSNPNDAVFVLSAGDKFAYQVCNQDQTPTSFSGVTDMFFDLPFNLDANDAMCFQRFGIHSQYNWAAYNFGLSAVRQSSNIYFTNGLYDPFIACGPTVNISDTITAQVYEGCHAYDAGPAYPEDPPSVTAARAQGATLIGQWVDAYNKAKATVPLSNAADVFGLSYSLGGYMQVVNDTLSGSQAFTSQLALEPYSKLSNQPSAV